MSPELILKYELSWRLLTKAMTIPQLKELNQLLCSSIIFLCETKNRLQYTEKVQRILNYDEGTIVEAMNKSSGMAMFWKREVKMKLVLHSAFIIEAYVGDHTNRCDWWLVGIYANCDDKVRNNSGR